MKAYDIIQQLFTTLPAQTDMFTTDVPLSTLSKVGTLATAVSSSAHALTTGDYVYIVGAKWKTAITTIARSGTIATATCSTPHDLTEVFFDTVELIGAAQAEFNGTFTILTVPNRYTFTFMVANSGPTTGTGSMFLLEPWRAGFNGWAQVTVTNSTTFTYVSTGSASVTAYGTMIARKKPRISGAASLERAEAAYTKYTTNQLWAFVVAGQVTSSKSNWVSNDAVNFSTESSVYLQYLLNDIFVYVFVPTSASLTARAERDQMTDVSKYLFKSMLGKTYPTYFVDQTTGVLSFVKHNQVVYRGAYYIHEFQFEGRSEINNNDIVEPDVTRAFRDLELNFQNEFDNTIMETDINLDDEPIV